MVQSLPLSRGVHLGRPLNPITGRRPVSAARLGRLGRLGRQRPAVFAGGFKFPELPEFQNPLDAIKKSLATNASAGSARARGPAAAKADTVFVAGASGRLGIRIVYELAMAGYRVRAGVRSQDKADGFDDELDGLCVSLGAELDKKARSNINLVYCDLQDEESIEPAIGNASRVICAVGAAESEFTNLSAPKLIDFEATETLITVAAACNVDQFVLVTSLGTGKLGFPAGVLNLFGGILIWKRKAEEALEQSGMRYLIVRPGGMERPTDNHRVMGYNMRLATRDSLFGGTVSRLQIAELIAAAVASPELATNKCVEVVAELGIPERSYEELLSGMPVEVDQEAREEAVGKIAALTSEEGRLRAKIEALSADLGETRDVIAELQVAVKEARAEEKEVLKENTEVLRAAQRTEAEIASLRELVEEQKLLAEAAKAVAGAQQRGMAAGVMLSPQEIASIRESVLYPPIEEEEEEEEVVAAGKKKGSASPSLFGGFQLPGVQLPKAEATVAAASAEEAEAEAVVATRKAGKKSNDSLFGNMVAFLEGDARRDADGDVEDVEDDEDDEEAEVAAEQEPEKPVAAARAESEEPKDAGFLGGFRIRNMFGGSDYAFIDEIETEGADEVEEPAEEPVAVAEEPVAVAEEPVPVAKEPVEEPVVKNLFPSIEMPKMPSFEMPKVEMPKIEVPTTAAPSAGASGNVEEARAWIQAWKDKTGDVLPLTPTPTPAAPTPTPAASIPASDAPNEEVRAWISAWRERTNK